MPIGLLHRAAPAVDRIEGAAGRVGALLASLRVGLFIDLFGFQIQELVIADILQDKGFFAVTDDDPLAPADLQLGHAAPPVGTSAWHIIPSRHPCLPNRELTPRGAFGFASEWRHPQR